MILTQLAQGTRDAHAHIERRVPLLDPHLHHDTYRSYLEAILGFYEPFEDRLAAFSWHRVGLDLEQRRKARLLREDLRHFGHDEGTLAVIRRCRDLPRPAHLLEAMGCLYVLEGATLGGRFLMPRVSQRLGITPASGGAFLASYGERVEHMWRSFGDALQRAVEGAARQQGELPRLCRLGRLGTVGTVGIVAAAQDTFAKLDRWLASALPPHG